MYFAWKTKVGFYWHTQAVNTALAPIIIRVFCLKPNKRRVLCINFVQTASWPMQSIYFRIGILILLTMMWLLCVLVEKYKNYTCILQAVHTGLAKLRFIVWSLTNVELKVIRGLCIVRNSYIADNFAEPTTMWLSCDFVENKGIQNQLFTLHLNRQIAFLLLKLDKRRVWYQFLKYDAFCSQVSSYNLIVQRLMW